MRPYIIIMSSIFMLVACSSNKDKEKAGETIPVSIIHPGTGALGDEISASGSISSEEESSLSFKVGGIVEKTFVTEGQEVKQGQLLARLNSSELSEQLRQADLNIAKLSRDEGRLQALVKDTIATVESLQNAQTALQTSRSQKQSILYNLSQTSIYAPCTGIIVRKEANEGEFKSPGAPIYVLASNAGKKKWVFKIALSDQERLKLKQGQQANVRLDALPGRNFTGKVSRLDKVPDAATGTYTCYISLDSADPSLVYGLSGHLSLRLTSDGSSETLIPLASLSGLKDSTAFIYVLNPDTTAKKMSVHIRQIKGAEVSINEKLGQETAIVTYGKSNIREGVKLRIVAP
ncbi:MAG: efflux RND transporter periplasmic adaptor subunit [Pedobacter sp.]|nr:MAG: efflux RND transporter periplasmic adaptor subunit [Pedobacter sp.]